MYMLWSETLRRGFVVAARLSAEASSENSRELNIEGHRNHYSPVCAPLYFIPSLIKNFQVTW